MAVFAPLAVAAPSCANPTAVEITVVSEVPCSANAEVSVRLAASASDLATAVPAAVARECTDLRDGTVRRGTVVLTPEADRTRLVAFAVATRPDGQPTDACTTSAAGCIVARREIHFQEHATTSLRVALRSSCLSVDCPAGATCVKGQCESDVVSASCGSACSESDLGAADAAPAPTDAGRDATDAATCGPFTTPPASSLKDTFAGSFSPDWTPINCMKEVGNGLVASPAANSPSSYCFAATTKSYHLTCDSITVKVPSPSMSQAVQTFIYVSGAQPGQKLDLLVESGDFFFGPEATLPKGPPYDPVKDVWWRLREAAGTLYLETSADGTVWRELARQADPFPLDDVGIALGAGVHSSQPNPGTSQFRCYNQPPPCQ